MPTARRRRAFGLLAIPVVVTLGVMLATQSRWRERLLPEPPLDTTRFAILPFAGASQFADSSRPEDLLVESMRRWRGLSLVESFEIGDAIRRRGVPSSIVESARLARQLGAGRFVRGQLARAAGQRTIVAALYDSKVGETASRSPDVRGGGVVAGHIDLPSTRRFHRASQPADRDAPRYRRRARQSASYATHAASGRRHEELDLSVAESLYAGALGYDPTSARAALWVAQFQVWFQDEAPLIDVRPAGASSGKRHVAPLRRRPDSRDGTRRAERRRLPGRLRAVRWYDEAKPAAVRRVVRAGAVLR